MQRLTVVGKCVDVIRQRLGAGLDGSAQAFGDDIGVVDFGENGILRSQPQGGHGRLIHDRYPQGLNRQPFK